MIQSPCFALDTQMHETTIKLIIAADRKTYESL